MCSIRYPTYRNLLNQLTYLHQNRVDIVGRIVIHLIALSIIHTLSKGRTIVESVASVARTFLFADDILAVRMLGLIHSYRP